MLYLGPGTGAPVNPHRIESRWNKRQWPRLMPMATRSYNQCPESKCKMKGRETSSQFSFLICQVRVLICVSTSEQTGSSASVRGVGTPEQRRCCCGTSLTKTQRTREILLPLRSRTRHVIKCKRTLRRPAGFTAHHGDEAPMFLFGMQPGKTRNTDERSDFTV